MTGAEPVRQPVGAARLKLVEIEREDPADPQLERRAVPLEALGACPRVDAHAEPRPPANRVPATVCRRVRNVIDHRSFVTGGMWCCHCVRAGPDRTYAERGSRVSSALSQARGRPRRNRIRHAVSSEMPLTSPNAGASRCQPIPAPGG